MLPSRHTADLLAGQLGAVPRRLVWDTAPIPQRCPRKLISAGSATGNQAARRPSRPPPQ
jgi:hypothetical protein